MVLPGSFEHLHMQQELFASRQHIEGRMQDVDWSPVVKAGLSFGSSLLLQQWQLHGAALRKLLGPCAAAGWVHLLICTALAAQPLSLADAKVACCSECQLACSRAVLRDALLCALQM
jgi:hypothetical protein